jgi:hypothetical protein
MDKGARLQRASSYSSAPYLRGSGGFSYVKSQTSSGREAALPEAFAAYGDSAHNDINSTSIVRN